MLWRRVARSGGSATEDGRWKAGEKRALKEASSGVKLWDDEVGKEQGEGGKAWGRKLLIKVPMGT